MKRFFLVTAIAISLAVLLTNVININISLICIFSAVLSVALIYCYLKFSFKFLDASIVFLIVFSFMLVYSSSFVSSRQHLAETYYGRTHYIHAKVCDESKNYNDYSTHFLKVYKIDNKDVKPFKSMISIDNELETEIGNEFSGLVKFDERETVSKSYYAEDIFVFGDFVKYSYNNSNKFNLFKASVRCRKFIENRFNNNLDTNISGIPIALLTGNKEFISDEFYSNVKATGMAHVMAVSGLHISIICGSIVLLLRKLKLGRKISCIVGLFILILIGFISGFSGSIIRATIMHLVIFSGDLFSRRADALNSLGLAVTIMLIINPYSVYNVGFLMSVCATLGILTISPRIYDKFSIKTESKNIFIKLYNSVLQILCLSISASILVAPISLYYFGFISIIAPLVNIATSILVTIILSSTAILAILPISFGYNLLEILCSVFKRIITLFANFSFCGFYSDDEMLYIMTAIIILIVILLKFFKHKVAQTILSLTIILVIAFSSYLQLYINNNTYKLYIPYSYKGMAMVIHNNDNCTVISNTIEYSAINDIKYYLSNNFIKDIDTLVLPSSNEKCYEKFINKIPKQNIKEIYGNKLEDICEISTITNLKNLKFESYITDGEYIISFNLGNEKFVFNTNALYVGECDYVLCDTPLISYSLIGERPHYIITKCDDNTLNEYNHLLKNKCKANIILNDNSLKLKKSFNKKLKFRD